MTAKPKPAKARKVAPDHHPQEWSKRIADAWQKTVQAIMETGALLIAAKAALQHGQFTSMVEAELPFDKRTAERLMAIARHPVVSNPAHAPLLPASWMTLYELSKLPDDVLLHEIEHGGITPKVGREQVASLHSQLKRKAAAERIEAAGPPQAPEGNPFAEKQPNTSALAIMATLLALDTDAGVMTKKLRQRLAGLDQILGHVDCNGYAFVESIIERHSLLSEVAQQIAARFKQKRDRFVVHQGGAP